MQVKHFSKKVNAILETCLYATDLPAMEAFYKEVLGLEPFSKADERYLFYYCGASVLLIFNPDFSADFTSVKKHHAKY